MNHRRRHTQRFVARKRRLRAAYEAHVRRERRILDEMAEVFRRFPFTIDGQGWSAPVPEFKPLVIPTRPMVVCHPRYAESPRVLALEAMGYERVIDKWAPEGGVYVIGADPRATPCE